MFLMQDKHEKPPLSIVTVGEEISMEHINLNQTFPEEELQTLPCSF